MKVTLTNGVTIETDNIEEALQIIKASKTKEDEFSQLKQETPIVKQKKKYTYRPERKFSRVCEYCKKPFMAVKPTGRFCSTVCVGKTMAKTALNARWSNRHLIDEGTIQEQKSPDKTIITRHGDEVRRIEKYGEKDILKIL
jgi:ribosomal protein S21